MAETLAQEFSRLVEKYSTAGSERSEKEEAWNLIADFAVSHSFKICVALERTFSPVGNSLDPTPALSSSHRAENNEQERQ